MSCEGTFIYPDYTAISIVAGTPNTLAFSAFNNIFRNYQVSAGVNFTLSTTFLRNGGQYRLLVTKTVAGDVVMTLPAGSVVTGDPGATTMTLSGANGEKFMIIFSYDGVATIFSMGGTAPGVSPGTPSNFSNNVIPYINGSGEWAEDTQFNYTSGNLNLGAGPAGAAKLTIYGASDVSGNALVAGNNSGSQILVVQNDRRLVHTYDNTNFGSIGVGYAAQFGRVSGIGLRIGTSATGAILQAVSTSGTFTKLNLNLFGGEVEIGPSTLASNSLFTVYTSPSTFALGTYSARIVGGSGSNIRVLNLIAGRVGTDNKLAIQGTEVGNAAHAIQLQPLGGNVAVGQDVNPTALLDIGASSAARASLRIDAGVAPTAPNDGDIWNNGTDLFVRLGGVTYTIQKA